MKKLKNNKGYAGVDIAIAIVLILLFLPTITGAIYNVKKTNISINRKTNAIRLATTVLETAKGTGYDGLALNSTGTTPFLTNLSQKLSGQIKGNENVVTFITTPSDSEEHYRITITLTSETDSKNIKVEVMYAIGKIQKTMDISTVINKN